MDILKSDESVYSRDNIRYILKNIQKIVKNNQAFRNLIENNLSNLLELDLVVNWDTVKLNNILGLSDKILNYIPKLYTICNSADSIQLFVDKSHKMPNDSIFDWFKNGKYSKTDIPLIKYMYNI